MIVLVGSVGLLWLGAVWDFWPLTLLGFLGILAVAIAPIRRR